jgi:hypothetical protein
MRSGHIVRRLEAVERLVVPQAGDGAEGAIARAVDNADPWELELLCLWVDWHKAKSTPGSEEEFTARTRAMLSLPEEIPAESVLRLLDERATFLLRELPDRPPPRPFPAALVAEFSEVNDEPEGAISAS